jgi:hypothetical protein
MANTHWFQKNNSLEGTAYDLSNEHDSSEIYALSFRQDYKNPYCILSYIQLNRHHLSKYFLLWDSKGTTNCLFRKSALQSSTSETHYRLMSILLFIKIIKTYSECGSPYAYFTFTTVWQVFIKFYVNIYHWVKPKFYCCVCDVAVVTVTTIPQLQYWFMINLHRLWVKHGWWCTTLC